MWSTISEDELRYRRGANYITLLISIQGYQRHDALGFDGNPSSAYSKSTQKIAPERSQISTWLLAVQTKTSNLQPLSLCLASEVSRCLLMPRSNAMNFVQIVATASNRALGVQGLLNNSDGLLSMSDSKQDPSRKQGQIKSAIKIRMPTGMRFRCSGTARTW